MSDDRIAEPWAATGPGHGDRSVGAGRRTDPGADALVAACRSVLAHAGADVPLDAVPIEEGDDWATRLRALCDAASLRHRRVMLRGPWWRHDSEPLVSVLRPEGGGPALPVALLPDGRGRISTVEPITGRRLSCDAALAVRVGPEAFEIRPPASGERLGPVQVVRQLMRGRTRDLCVVGATAALSSAASVVAPWTLARLLEDAIPSGARSEVTIVLACLVASGAAAWMFHVARSLSVLRLLTRLDAGVQARFWDRLLRLPVSFFRHYAVGDLANRALAADQIRERAQADVTTAVAGLVASLLAFGVMGAQSWQVTCVALASLVPLGAAVAGLMRLHLRHLDAMCVVEGSISSVAFALIRGVGKLRVAGAERRAYLRWEHAFDEQRLVAARAQRVHIWQSVLVGGFAVAAEAALLGAMLALGPQRPSAARLLGLAAAFGQLIAATLTVVVLLPEALAAIAAFRQAKPILDHALEAAPQRKTAPRLRGRIALTGVSFRYRPGGPLALNDVSIEAAEGEFIALVGPSGCGKSTILRLLLGFERSESGAVSYDGLDLTELDADSVRRQLGVVLQDSRPMSGDVYSCIAGGSDSDRTAVWEAARLAALDDDIRAMPMGLHTIIGEGAPGFSGGQRQRMMIARALVRRPRILLLDEATSALDNTTQAAIRHNLDGLRVTRVVAAHRLSTIARADRIYVLESGRVIQVGTYSDLIGQSGAFQQFARRQVDAYSTDRLG